MERLMLLDGNGLIYRGYFALPPLTTSKGELVNAVFGFCSIVLRGIQDIRPDYVAVAFDLAGPTFRHERFADYKATRVADAGRPAGPVPEGPRGREGAPVPGLRAGRASRRTTSSARSPSRRRRRGLDTTIVTGDLDMLQIVSDRVRLMTTRSGVENTILYDPARIHERFELAPSQMIDYKALKGDTTDNIPGVPGVGEKTAAKLIREFGDLDAVYARLDEVKPDKLREKLAEHREQVFLGQRAVHDHPGPPGLPRPRGSAPRRLRPRGGHPALPRVRVPVTPRPAAAAQRRIGDRHRGRDPRRQPDRARGPRRHGPAGRVGERPPDPRRCFAGGRAPSGSLQLSLDFGAVGAGAGTDAAGAALGRRARRPTTFEDLPTALAAAIADPGPPRAPRGRRDRCPRLVDRRAVRARRRARSSTTRGRGWARRWRSPSPVATAAWSSPADRPTATGSGTSPRQAASRSWATR